MRMVQACDIKTSLPPGARILDVRTPVEHKEECLSCVHDHVPLDQLDPAAYLQGKGLAKDTPLYLLCRSGSRARKAADAFAALGCTQVHAIEGGLTACRAQGVACRKDGSVISLERQVRIAAGFLVLLGAVLGYAVDPLWHGLSAFVGGGLVFAGITNYCGMALVIARASWSRS